MRRRRIRSGSAVQVCCTGWCLIPPRLADELVGGGQDLTGAGQLHQRLGVGVCISHKPPSAVAAIRYRSSSSAPSPCQDWAQTGR